jgi:hypothetical protein
VGRQPGRPLALGAGAPLGGRGRQRRLTGQHLIRQAAERLDVSALIDPPAGGLITEDLRQTEIQHLDRTSRARLAIARGRRLDQEHALGRQIPVNDAGPVGRRQHAGHRADDALGLRKRQPRFPLQSLREPLAVQALHHQIGARGGLPVIQHPNDARMLQPTERADLTLEARPQLGIRRVAPGQHPDRHLALRGGVDAPVDGALAVLPELLGENVVAQLLRVDVHGEPLEKSAAARSHTRTGSFPARPARRGG